MERNGKKLDISHVGHSLKSNVPQTRKSFISISKLTSKNNVFS